MVSNPSFSQAVMMAWQAYSQGSTAISMRFGSWGPFKRSDFEAGGQYWQLVSSTPLGPRGAPGGGFNPGAGFPSQGTGSAGSAPSAGGNAAPMVAVNANTPTITGGGAGFAIGAVDNQSVLTAYPGEWEGVDTATPDTKLPESMSPEGTENWNGLARFGAKCVRRGLMKMSEDRESVTISASPIAAAYRAVSIVPIANADYALMCFADNDGTIGAALSAEPVSLHIVSTFPRWGRPVDLSGRAGPKLTLTEPVGGTIRITYDYTNLWSTVALQKISVKSVTIRYNTGAGDITFPIELDTIRDDGTARRAGTAAKDRATWDGVSTFVDVAGLASGTTIYVSAWAHGLLGTSERSTAVRTVA